MKTLTKIRDALDTVFECALDDDLDTRRVTCALMKALSLPGWERVEEVLANPHCLHNDCAGELYPTQDFIDRECLTWRCDDCNAITIVDGERNETWTEPCCL